MGMIQFVANYDDLSTDKGYQFRFHCDKCGNGFMSRFHTSKIGLAGSVLRAAGNIFGGWASSAGHGAYEIQRVVGGPEHDSALREAVEEGKQYFKQCTRCGKWVCPEVCWNSKASLCEACAPDFTEEIAASQAHAKADAARLQMYEKAMQQNYAANIDMSADSQIAAPATRESSPSTPACQHCGADIGTAKFCPECGKPTAVVKPRCPSCNLQLDKPAKFCPECGAKMR